MSKKAVEKIMVFGTFDGLHKGHLNFFKQAKALTSPSFLIVSVARDENVFKIKGSYPVLSVHQRATLIRKNKLADEVVIGGLRSHLPHIVKARPNIIALGYDQKDYIKNLKKDLKAKDLNVKIVRLKPYKEKIFKNSLLKLKTKI
jgi:FAD synthetase